MTDTSGLVVVRFLLPDRLRKGEKVKSRTMTMTHVPRVGDMVVPVFDDEIDGTTYTVMSVIWFPAEAALAVSVIVK